MVRKRRKTGTDVTMKSQLENADGDPQDESQRPSFRFSGRKGAPIDLRTQQPGNLPADVQRTLARIARERHIRTEKSGATSIPPIAAAKTPVERRASDLRSVPVSPASSHPLTPLTPPPLKSPATGTPHIESVAVPSSSKESEMSRPVPLPVPPESSDTTSDATPSTKPKDKPAMTDSERKKRAKARAKRQKMMAKEKAKQEKTEASEKKSGFSLKRVFGSSKSAQPESDATQALTEAETSEGSALTEIPVPTLDAVFAEPVLNSDSGTTELDEVQNDASSSGPIVHQEPEFQLLPVAVAETPELSFPEPPTAPDPIEPPAGFADLEDIALDDLIASTLEQLEQDMDASAEPRSDVPTLEEVDADDLTALAAELDAVSTEINAATVITSDSAAVEAVTTEEPTVAEPTVTVDVTPTTTETPAELPMPKTPEPAVAAPVSAAPAASRPASPKKTVKPKAAATPPKAEAHPVAEISTRKYRGTVVQGTVPQQVAVDNPRQQEREVRDRIAHKHRELQRMFGRLS